MPSKKPTMVVRMDQGLLDRVRAAAALATRTPTNFVLRLIQEGVPMPAPPAPQESGSRPESGESGHGAGSGVQGRSLGR